MPCLRDEALTLSSKPDFCSSLPTEPCTPTAEPCTRPPCTLSAASGANGSLEIGFLSHRTHHPMEAAFTLTSKPDFCSSLPTEPLYPNRSAMHPPSCTLSAANGSLPAPTMHPDRPCTAERSERVSTWAYQHPDRPCTPSLASAANIQSPDPFGVAVGLGVSVGGGAVAVLGLGSSTIVKLRMLLHGLS
jgi:hypothetical protein